MISLSFTCQRNTTCNLYCFQMTLKYHIPTHSLCFLDTIIQPNQHHSPEYLKPSCIDIIVISPICNWNPIMALSSSFHQHSLLVPVPYDKHPTHSNTIPFTTIEAHTYSFYSCHSLQSMVPIIHAVIQPIRWIHGTHKRTGYAPLKMVRPEPVIFSAQEANTTMIMMGRFALTESMGRYSLPKQLDNIITRKVKIK